MIYGRVAALATLGIFSDLVFRGKNYLLLLCFAFLACLMHFAQIVLFLVQCKIPSPEVIQHVTYGYYSATLSTLMSILIPLFIAARKRDQDSVFDVPIAAMVLSTS